MGLLTIVVFSIIVAITVAKHKYKSRRSVSLFTRPFSKLFTTVLCCSKADLCTTTENVAYVSTLKPVARPSGQNPVYEEIYRSDMSTYISHTAIDPSTFVTPFHTVMHWGPVVVLVKTKCMKKFTGEIRVYTYIHITHCHRSITILCHSIPHSDAVGTGGGDDTGTTENVAYATSTRRPAADSIHSIHKLETAEFEPKTRDEETD